MSDDHPRQPDTYRHAQSPIKGILWMVSAAVFFSIAFGFVKHLSTNIHAFEQTFFRQLMGALIILPFLLRHGMAGFKTHQLKINLTRNIAGYAAISMSFLSATLIPLADSLALQFTLPLFTIIFAFVILHERPGPHRWAALFIGFAGAVMILRPGFIEISVGMIAALGAAAAFGVSDTLLRKLSQTDDTNSIIFYGFAMQVPLAIPLAVYHWVTPNAEEWLWLLAMGLSSFAAQYSLSKSFMSAEASLVSPVLFIRLPMVAAIGFFFFGQVPDIWVWIGAAVIFASTFYAARREALHARRAKEQADAA